MSAVTVTFVAIDGLLLCSAIAIAIFYWLLTRSTQAAPRLAPVTAPIITAPIDASSLAVIIPAYNEALNLRACVESVLASVQAQPSPVTVWIADDQSTDETSTIAAQLAQQYDIVQSITVPPRPQGEQWVGKNWACAQASCLTDAKYLLFLDADVRLQPGAIAAALHDANKYQTDLLSCAPRIDCDCWAEWLVQPIMMSAIAIGYDFSTINTSEKVEDAFAAGPFMLFRRDAYDQIDGHRSVRDVVVEDVELARQIRRAGLHLRYVLGTDLLSVRMYHTFAALWEGWTKNYYLGTQRNVLLTLFSAFTIAMVFIMPWIGGLGCVGLSLGFTGAIPSDWYAIAGFYGLTALSLSLYLGLRVQGYRQINIPIRYWWLSSVGGVLVVGIAIASIIKTETGWGWTWRGRSLKG